MGMLVMHEMPRRGILGERATRAFHPRSECLEAMILVQSARISQATEIGRWLQARMHCAHNWGQK